LPTRKTYFCSSFQFLFNLLFALPWIPFPLAPPLNPPATLLSWEAVLLSPFSPSSGLLNRHQLMGRSNQVSLRGDGIPLPWLCFFGWSFNSLEPGEHAWWCKYFIVERYLNCVAAHREPGSPVVFVFLYQLLPRTGICWQRPWVVVVILVCLISVASSQLTLREVTPNRIVGTYSQPGYALHFESEPNKLVLQNRFRNTLLYVDDKGGNTSVANVGVFQDEKIELKMVVDTAVAMGAQRISGVVYPSAMPIYAAAMQIASKLDYNPALPEAVHSPQGLQPNCEVPEPPNCLGLCGSTCSCWEWVCDNCCWNLGCYCHDLCCDSYIDPNCWSKIIGLRCNEPYRCDHNTHEPRCV